MKQIRIIAADKQHLDSLVYDYVNHLNMSFLYIDSGFVELRNDEYIITIEHHAKY